MMGSALFSMPGRLSSQVGRRYLGSQRVLASGTWTKEAALGLPFVAGLTAEKLEVEIEAVGGGGGGQGDEGGFPGCVVYDRFRFSALPETVECTIGAGGPDSTNGGNTTFGELLLAWGGTRGIASDQGATENAPRTMAVYPTRYTRDSADGPAAGASSNAGPMGMQTPGGTSCQAFPSRSRPSGASARTPFEFGAGGANATMMDPAQNGGVPGGGGGAGSTMDGAPSGSGGAGEIRLHFFAYD